MVRFTPAAVAVMAVIGGGLAVSGVALRDDDALPAPVIVRDLPSSAEVVDTDDEPLSRGEARRARRAALRVTGGGLVTEIDRSDDPGEHYEVEVVKDRREYDIALDEDVEPVPNRRYGD
jgi:hypothetical protein